MDKKKIIYFIIIGLVFLLSIGGSLFVGAKYKNNIPIIESIIKTEQAQVIGDYEKALEQSNEVISILEDELDKEKKINEEMNKKLNELKKKATEIKEPKDMSEVIKRFHDLGYDVQ
jgi:prefoldin subunit 5